MEFLRDEEYRKALKLARDAFLRSNFEERCRIAGAEWIPCDPGGTVNLPFFQNTCQITIPDFEFSLRGSQNRLSLNNRILILHYLNGVKDIPVMNENISFKDVPSGEFYYPAFARRSIEPLLQTFGKAPQAFKSAGESLGGKLVEMGDMGLKISVFPKVPLTLILWSGDEDFSPDLNILFDATIQEFLSTEDVAVLGQEAMIRMIKSYYSHLKK
ncbi:MAG: DUF3786 domain-containing protein [Deltaproteobacteria bacterium]|nr:DUF3786 domain-containing protein [Deltaproteobacteria bacterium]